MYYVVSEYYVETGCDLLSIVEQIPENQATHIKFSSNNYNECLELVEIYDQELNERVAFEEANLG